MIAGIEIPPNTVPWHSKLTQHKAVRGNRHRLPYPSYTRVGWVSTDERHTEAKQEKDSRNQAKADVF